MRLSSRLSDENKQAGEVESIFNFEKYVFSSDKDCDAEDEDDRIIINAGDSVGIEIGQIFLPLYSSLCDDIVSFTSIPNLHCLVISSKMISIDCQLQCGKFSPKDQRCKRCIPYVQSWFLIESFNRFLIISLDVLICRYSPLLRAFPALFISEEPHKSFYYPSCFHPQK